MLLHGLCIPLIHLQVATADIEDVRSFRASPSRGLQANQTEPFRRIEVDVRLSRESADLDPLLRPTEPIEIRYHTPEEEIALGPASWLWDCTFLVS